jgi:hypothetical protein
MNREQILELAERLELVYIVSDGVFGVGSTVDVSHRIVRFAKLIAHWERAAWVKTDPMSLIPDAQQLMDACQRLLPKFELAHIKASIASLGLVLPTKKEEVMPLIYSINTTIPAGYQLLRSLIMDA